MPYPLAHANRDDMAIWRMLELLAAASMLLRRCAGPLTIPARRHDRPRAMKLPRFAACVASILSCPALAGLQEGVAAYEAGNVALAAKEFRAAAEHGNADCQFNLALMYEQGIGVGKDAKQAITWYRRAAEQGNSNAQYNLAVLYENGRGSDVDFAQAHKWYRKAAMQGDGLAVGNLGMLYLRGQGVKPDRVAGLALLLLSVTMDHSLENRAKQNISSASGLTQEIVAAAQTLSAEMGNASNLLLPLDQYLKKTGIDARHPG